MEIIKAVMGQTGICEIDKLRYLLRVESKSTPKFAKNKF